MCIKGRIRYMVDIGLIANLFLFVDKVFLNLPILVDNGSRFFDLEFNLAECQVLLSKHSSKRITAIQVIKVLHLGRSKGLKEKTRDLKIDGLFRHASAVSVDTGQGLLLENPIGFEPAVRASHNGTVSLIPCDHP